MYIAQPRRKAGRCFPASAWSRWRATPPFPEMSGLPSHFLQWAKQPCKKLVPAQVIDSAGNERQNYESYKPIKRSRYRAPKHAPGEDRFAAGYEDALCHVSGPRRLCRGAWRPRPNTTHKTNTAQPFCLLSAPGKLWRIPLSRRSPQQQRAARECRRKTGQRTYPIANPAISRQPRL